MRRFFICFVAVAWLLTPQRAEAQLEYGYVQLLRKTFNLNILPAFDPDGTQAGGFSSTDPASRIENGQRVDWFSNKDKGNFLRQDPEGHVLADIKGPGMVTHIWCDNPQGKFKLFIDREARPTLVADFKRLFLGHYDPITYPFVAFTARGANLYFPISFQRHCRIVVEDPGDMAYEIDYLRWPVDTKVKEPFSFARAQKPNGDAIRWIALRLADDPQKIKGQSIGEKPEIIKPGESRNSWLRVGPAVLHSFYVEVSAPDLPRALREVLLTINFDEQDTPQVWSPVGDFFGSGPGVNSYITVPMGVDGNKFYSKFRMPYKHSCEINFLNEGDQDVAVKVYTTAMSARGFGERVGYFNAKWRRVHPNTDPEWTIADIQGKGSYIGTMLSVWNPTEAWWGEGDFRFYMDGATNPAIHGTSTEDHFGAAFGDPTLFEHPYLTQTIAEGPNHSGYTSMLRWHILDRIPFAKSLKVTVENYGTDKEYAATSYWYGAPGSTDDFKPIPVKERIPRALVAGLVLANAFEGEKMLVIGSKVPEVLTSESETRGFEGQWSLNRQFVWRPKEVGEWIKLTGMIAPPGKYELVVHATKGPDYGIVQYSVEGQKLGKPMDMYAEKMTPTGPITLGEVTVTALPDPVVVEVTGKNAKSNGLAVGIDAFQLVAKKAAGTGGVAKPAAPK